MEEMADNERERERQVNETSPFGVYEEDFEGLCVPTGKVSVTETGEIGKA
jgi:hypothetical protein